MSNKTGSQGSPDMRAIFPAQEEEDLIRQFFRDRPPGFFVDVGAAEPEFGSQSAHLEQMGWSGILVEPRPEQAERLRRARRAAVYQVACSSPCNAGRTMTLHVRGGYSSLSETLVIAGLEPQGTIDVAVRTLDELLTDAAAPAPIDFVSIDVEGHEPEVLEGFDLARWKPRLILVEDHILTLTLHRALERRGYAWVRRTGLNGWYVPADAATAVGWFGRMQFVRKYYFDIPTRWVRDGWRKVRAAAGILPPSRGR